MSYLVGTSGFSFDDWLGPVYPAGLLKSMWLQYYEQALGFDAVELNFTYYTMPTARTLESMVHRTGSDFTFVVRSHRAMTHEIWQDETRKVLRDTSEAFRTFGEGIRPLVEARRLGCVLIQFPVFFYPVPASFEYLRRLPELLPGVPLVIEFRNRSWLRDTAFQLLEETGMGFCIVDEPRLARLMPFEPRRTARIAYCRLHGRNPNWFNAPREERYNYFYSGQELGEFVPPLRSVASGAKNTFVFFNNCHAGSAARNALMMKQMLGLAGSFTQEQQRVVDGSPAA